MATLKRSPKAKLRGQKSTCIPWTLSFSRLSASGVSIISAMIRRSMLLSGCGTGRRSNRHTPGSEPSSRLDQSEVERLVQTTYRSQSKYGLMIKTLFQTGCKGE